MLRFQRAFTLIELMIVMAIIAILAAVAISAYANYAARSADYACLQEAKSYAESALVVMHQIDSPGTIPSPALKACSSLTQAVDFSTDLKGKSRAPGSAIITCEMKKAHCYM
ncbi:prepilin-type N-terminal cleavage/methylation domain-containing protein [Azonexus caeni]|uniref:prepilin-type N-terminal cleavage/methylation domain-containing protein n=1 Tax=Azonexus caeni TaxID=266126 RepID=UPI003A85CFAE